MRIDSLSLSHRELWMAEKWSFGTQFSQFECSFIYWITNHPKLKAKHKHLTQTSELNFDSILLRWKSRKAMNSGIFTIETIDSSIHDFRWMKINRKCFVRVRVHWCTYQIASTIFDFVSILKLHLRNNNNKIIIEMREYDRQTDTEREREQFR